MKKAAVIVAERTLLGVIFAVVLLILIAFARGYRFDLTQKTLDSTGILVAASTPDGAKIYINGELRGATNENISLNPGQYDIEIKKDGFSSWYRHITIKGELVIKLDALLFPLNPSLSPVTSLGLVKTATSPTKNKSVIMTQTGDVEKDGIYVLENSKNPLSTVNQIQLLVPKSALPFATDLSESEIQFSPDESEVIVSIYSKRDETVPSSQPVLLDIYLISLSELSENPFSIMPSVNILKDAWKAESEKILARRIETFKKPLPLHIADSFEILGFSENEEKILYRAKKNGELPIIINPRIIATNQNYEDRMLIKGNIYSYDSKEDKNFKIFDAKDIPQLSNNEIKNDAEDEEGDITTAGSLLSDYVFWYPDSGHIVIMYPQETLNEEKKLSDPPRIIVADYDGHNRAEVYTGPFDPSFLSITKDGRLLILTNLNARSGADSDIYAVGIR